MIGSRTHVRVHVHRAPTDMRKSFDTLAGLVQQQMGLEVLAGDVFLFVGKDRKRAKVLYFDGTGMCLLCKRLSKGRFASVWDAEHGQQLTHSELALFLEGSTLVGKQPLSPKMLAQADLFMRPNDFR